MKVPLPGAAFGALDKSSFRHEHNEVWLRLLQHKISLSRGRGMTVTIDLSPGDLRLVRQAMLELVQEKHGKSFKERGKHETNVMISLQTAIGRVDDVLEGRKVRLY